jgi:hypothetical protein
VCGKVRDEMDDQSFKALSGLSEVLIQLPMKGS